jgi:hypothetical protein
MVFFHREDAFLFATLSARDWGSIEITAVLPTALESESRQIPLRGLVHLALYRIQFYAACEPDSPAKVAFSA